MPGTYLPVGRAGTASETVNVQVTVWQPSGSTELFSEGRNWLPSPSGLRCPARPSTSRFSVSKVLSERVVFKRVISSLSSSSTSSSSTAFEFLRFCFAILTYSQRTDSKAAEQEKQLYFSAEIKIPSRPKAGARKDSTNPLFKNALQVCNARTQQIHFGAQGQPTHKPPRKKPG